MQQAARRRLRRHARVLLLVNAREAELGEEQHRAQRAQHVHHVRLFHPDGAHRLARALQLLAVVDTLDARAARLIEQRKLLNRPGQVHARALVLGEAGEQLVEDVVIALALALLHDARLLEEVDVDARARHLVRPVELDLDELAEAR